MSEYDFPCLNYFLGSIKETPAIIFQFYKEKNNTRIK